MQRPKMLVAMIAMTVLSFGIGVPAAAAENGASRVPAVTAGSAGDPAPKPSSVNANTLTSPACDAPAAGKYACVQFTRSSSATAHPTGDSSTDAIQPVPSWCYNGGVWGTRTEACEAIVVTYTTLRIINGVTSVTGQVSFDAVGYSYSSPDVSTWGHQFSIASYYGWGDALRARVSGSAWSSGSCTRRSSSFPAQPVEPVYSVRSGEAYFDTTATALDAVGFCTTTWNINFTNPGYSTVGFSHSLREIRCDNATPAQGFRVRRIGCVVYWYASAVFYSQSRYPSLVRHVRLAQESGLPGNSFAAPLNRTTDQTIIDTNRNLACGNAPSLPGLSCDEYPLATTTQGLSAGGTLRTFDLCYIDAPPGTGPTGASACMITATENNAQGGVMATFYYDWRVLNGDPFLVLISA